MTADATYSCRVYFDTGNDQYYIESTAKIDAVSITAYSVVTDGSAATISCVLSDSTSATVSGEWIDSSGSTVAAKSDAAGSVVNGVYSSNNHEMSISINSVSASATYTCKFVWESGVDELLSEAFFNFLSKITLLDAQL